MSELASSPGKPKPGCTQLCPRKSSSVKSLTHSRQPLGSCLCFCPRGPSVAAKQAGKPERNPQSSSGATIQEVSWLEVKDFLRCVFHSWFTHAMSPDDTNGSCLKWLLQEPKAGSVTLQGHPSLSTGVGLINWQAKGLPRKAKNI